MNWLLLFVPLSVFLDYVVHAAPTWVFLSALIAIVPIADWIRKATEQVALHSGSTVGGLLNVTFGNMAELILALFVLSAGQANVAKAQITGSLIGNSLLGLGLAALIGGIGRERQKFSKERVGLLSSLLTLAMLALIIPAAFDYTERGTLHVKDASNLDDRMSLAVSVVLILIYLANLVYTFVTHRDIFAPAEDREIPTWSLAKAIGVLLGATAIVALEAELVSGALQPTAKSLGLTEFFLGITVLAVVGNASEYISAVYFARKDRMGLVMSITVGATIQVALLIAPILVIASHFMGHPMNLVFVSPLELIAIAGIAFAVNAISHDGETTWFEGVMLLGVYLVLAIAFYYVTPH